MNKEIEKVIEEKFKEDWKKNGVGGLSNPAYEKAIYKAGWMACVEWQKNSKTKPWRYTGRICIECYENITTNGELERCGCGKGINFKQEQK
jgi:hypothetical protein